MLGVSAGDTRQVCEDGGSDVRMRADSVVSRGLFQVTSPLWMSLRLLPAASKKGAFQRQGGGWGGGVGEADAPGSAVTSGNR